jgi:hypothetical protein
LNPFERTGLQKSKIFACAFQKRVLSKKRSFFKEPLRQKPPVFEPVIKNLRFLKEPKSFAF